MYISDAHMYIYIHKYTYVYFWTYACSYICVQVHKVARVWLRTGIEWNTEKYKYKPIRMLINMRMHMLRTYIHTYVYAYKYISIYICIYICNSNAGISLYIYMYRSSYTHIHICTCTYICMYTQMYTYIYIYICVEVLTKRAQHGGDFQGFPTRCSTLKGRGIGGDRLTATLGCLDRGAWFKISRLYVGAQIF